MSVMANEGRGGFRPTASQNNPMNVSATGGAGQAAMYTPGVENAREFYETQTSAPISGTTPGVQPQVNTTRPSRANRASSKPMNLTPLDAPTQFPGEPVTTGINMGPGAGTEVMYANNQTLSAEDLNKLREALPTMLRVAESPSSTNAYRNFVRYVKSIV